MVPMVVDPTEELSRLNRRTGVFIAVVTTPYLLLVASLILARTGYAVGNYETDATTLAATVMALILVPPAVEIVSLAWFSNRVGLRRRSRVALCVSVPVIIVGVAILASLALPLLLLMPIGVAVPVVIAVVAARRRARAFDQDRYSVEALLAQSGSLMPMPAGRGGDGVSPF